MPMFNSAHGEPLDERKFQTEFNDSKSTAKFHITKKSTQLLTRMDNFKLVEETKEIFVIDDYGMYVMFDCTLSDMMELDQELLKVGSYFVRKNDQDLDMRTHSFPLTDRFQLLEDLYECEFEYQFAKAKVLMCYLEAFEHICDPLEQQRMM